MKGAKVCRIVATVAVIILFVGRYGDKVAVAQAPSQGLSTGKGAAAYDLQRSVRLYNYNGAGPSGPPRGEQLYFFKCWVCHNKYTKERAGPLLKDIYKRSVLMTTGKPVNDEAVAEKIREGGPLMPAYRYGLTEVDMADLLSYLRSGKCCYEGEEQLPNPWYKTR